MPLDLTGNKLSSTSIGSKGEVLKHIVNDNLLLHLDAANKNSYSGSGTVWTDLSGNGYNGTLTNGPTFNSTNSGVLVLDGTNDYISVNVNSFIRSNSSAYTFSSFFRLSASDGAAPFSLMTYPNDNNNNDGFWQHLNLGNWLWRVEDNVSGEFGGNVEAPSTFVTNTWYNVTVVVKTNTLIFYRNGTLINTINTTFNWANLRTDGTAYLYIGTGYGENYFLNGYIANMLMYNKELSSTEIKQNYLAQKSRFGL